MKKHLINFIYKIPVINLLMGYNFLSKNYLYKKGWNRSFLSKKPIDMDGNPLPWYTYGAIDFIKPRLKKNFTVFEYGSGNSTLWLSSFVEKVVSAEHDTEWFSFIKNQLSKKDNIEYHEVDLKDYPNEILKYDHAFDIIVLDGRKRNECAFNCLKALKEDGIIIWDNSDRAEYKDGYDFLESNNFRKIEFWGLGPIGQNEWCTTIYYKNNNCFNI